MRYILILLGLFGAVVGAIAVEQGGVNTSSRFLGLGFMVGGMTFVGLGFATCDIVNAINHQRR